MRAAAKRLRAKKFFETLESLRKIIFSIYFFKKSVKIGTNPEALVCYCRRIPKPWNP